ncbi:MAG: hypothetical protein JSR33_11145 [Proteobacteria bacterium]|nr:hypothetical protein [Pseudomonadota bacterium]
MLFNPPFGHNVTIEIHKAREAGKALLDDDIKKHNLGAKTRFINSVMKISATNKTVPQEYHQCIILWGEFKARISPWLAYTISDQKLNLIQHQLKCELRSIINQYDEIISNYEYNPEFLNKKRISEILIKLKDRLENHFYVKHPVIKWVIRELAEELSDLKVFDSSPFKGILV